MMNLPTGVSGTADGIRFGNLNRRYQRTSVAGFVGDIADGNIVVGGMIEDVSTGGFKMTGIPGFFRAEKHTYRVVLSGGGKHYRLLAKPCWRKKEPGSDRAEMGFKILDAPWEWVELTMQESSDESGKEIV